MHQLRSSGQFNGKVHTSLAVLAMSEKAGGTMAVLGISRGIDMLMLLKAR